MKVIGRVVTKTINAEGHSQVRFACEVDPSAGANAQQPVKCEFILSTPSAELADTFKNGQTVSFNL